MIGLLLHIMHLFSKLIGRDAFLRSEARDEVACRRKTAGKSDISNAFISGDQKLFRLINSDKI